MLVVDLALIANVTPNESLSRSYAELELFRVSVSVSKVKKVLFVECELCTRMRERANSNCLDLELEKVTRVLFC